MMDMNLLFYKLNIWLFENLPPDQLQQMAGKEESNGEKKRQMAIYSKIRNKHADERVNLNKCSICNLPIDAQILNSEKIS